MSETITLQQLLQEIKTTRSEIIGKIEASETRLLMKIESVNERVKELEKENAILREEVEKLKRDNNENSIVIFGLTIPTEDFEVEKICHQFQDLVDVIVEPSDINNFYKLGKTPESPIKIQFISYLKKQEVLRNCFKLKGKNVTIKTDQTLQQRQGAKILGYHLHRAKQAKQNCYIKRNTLYINNKAFKPEDLAWEEEFEKRRINSDPATPIPNQKKEENITVQEIIPVTATLGEANISTPQREVETKKRITRQNPLLQTKKPK